MVIAAVGLNTPRAIRNEAGTPGTVQLQIAQSTIDNQNHDLIGFQCKKDLHRKCKHPTKRIALVIEGRVCQYPLGAIGIVSILGGVGKRGIATRDPPTR